MTRTCINILTKLEWGYQAAVDAQLPFFEAKMSGIVDSVGVCDSKKTVGVQLGTDVGINVNLNAGKVNEAPSFEKDLYETSWPLFSTCVPVGPDNAKPTETPEPEPTKEPEPEPTEEPSEPEVTDEPSTEVPTSAEGPVETGTGNMPMMTGAPSLVTGTGTASAGWPMYTGNTTFLVMAKRRPTALYL